MADHYMPVLAPVESEDGRRELVERLAASAVFQRAHRLRAFFVYVSTCALENRPEQATEQQIGVHVFEREPTYNPNEDNIVRAQARLLRMKLEHYFANEGKDEPYLITIPKGQYVPIFEPRRRKVAVLPVAEDASPNRRHRHFLVPLLVCVSVILAACSVGLWIRAGVSHTQKLPGAFTAFWSTLLPGEAPTQVIASDQTYGLLQEAAHRDIPLSQYLSAGYGESGLAGVFEKFDQRRLTSLYDVASVLRLSAFDEFRRARVSVRYARDINVRDLASGNLILIGSRHMNPWVELFDRDLKFGCDYDYGTGESYYVNRSPRAGEQPAYRGTKAGAERVTYGGAAFFKTEKGQRVLIISGTSAAGVEMAAEFLTDPGSSAKLMDRIYSASSQGVRSFELILRVVSLSEQQAGRPEIVLLRTDSR